MGKPKRRRDREKERRESDAPPSRDHEEAKAEGTSKSAPSVDPKDREKLTKAWKRVLLLAVAISYLATVWLDGVGSSLPSRTLPRPWVYFAQVAALFKNAGMMSIDYRAEGWVCSEKKWVEIDVRPFFLVDADTKESRFHRALQFYRHERKVMRALDEYVVKSANGARGDDARRIGGVRFLSLRVPFPKPGEKVEPYERKPLASYPDDQRHAWYWSPKSMRIQRCGSADAVPPDAEDDDDKAEKEKNEKAEKRRKGHARSSTMPSASSSSFSPFVPPSADPMKEPEQ